MDYKSQYADGVLEQKVQASEDRNLADCIEGGRLRRMRFGANWQEVDIDEIVEKIAPGASPEYRKGKIYYINEEESLAVVADVGGGCLRIQDLTAGIKKPRYLDADGNDAHNVADGAGKVRGRSKAEYEAATHFLIKKRKQRRQS